MKVVSERQAVVVQVPATSPFPNLPSVEVSMQYRRKRVGGDYFDAFFVGDDYLFFLLIDIAGKSDRAMPVAASVQEMIRAEAPVLFGGQGNKNEQMSEMTMLLNRAIMAEGGGVKNSPGFLGLYNHKLGLLSYCNAGHLPGLIKEEELVTILPSGGIPLGLFGHYAPEVKVLAIQPETVLLLASKGLVHARCGREEFGVDRLAGFLGSHSFPSGKQWCAETLGEVERFQRQATHFGPQFPFLGLGKRGEGEDATVATLIRKVGSIVLAA